MLVYREDPLQKTNQGGLNNGNKWSKVVYVYGSSDRSRYLIEIIKKYWRLLLNSKACKKLYLCCRKAPTPSVWYYDQPYGVNKIQSTVKDICKEAGISGNFTNHSLRASCASWMYDQNMPEQLIKEVTGHKSDCVRIYKRTSDHLREAASSTISGVNPCKKVKIDENESVQESNVEEGMVQNVKCKGIELSYEQMVANVNKTKEEMRKKLARKFRIKAKQLLKRSRKWTIDVNLNINK